MHYLTVVNQIPSIKMPVPFSFSAWSPQIPAYPTLNDVQPEATGGSRGTTLTVGYGYKCQIYNLCIYIYIYIYIYILQSYIQTYHVRYEIIRCMCMTPYQSAPLTYQIKSAFASNKQSHAGIIDRHETASNQRYLKNSRGGDWRTGSIWNVKHLVFRCGLFLAHF